MLAVLATSLVNPRVHGEEGPGGDNDPLLGAIDEGKIYRKVDGHPITGKEVADVLIEKNWKTELEAYRDHVIAREESERAGIVVTDREIDDELTRQAQLIAAQVGQDPKNFNVEQMAKTLGTPLNFLRETMRDTMGIFKGLVQDAKIKAEEHLNDPKVKELMTEKLEKLTKQRSVVVDPARLSEGEAIRIGGVGHGKDRVRAYMKERLGALHRSEIVEVLDKITLQYVAARALTEVRKRKLQDEAARVAGFKDQADYEAAKPSSEQAAKYQAFIKEKESADEGKEIITREDRIFHLSYRARIIEAEQDVPSGQQVLRQQLQNQGVTEEQFINERAFTIDAIYTALARALIGMKEIRAEWDASKDKYKRREQKLAHVFVRVRDPQGQPYGPGWEVPNNPKLNEFVAKVREERFAKGKLQIDALAGPAKADFEAVAKASSDDEKSKDKGGLIGRVGAHTVLPELSVDQHIFEAAKDLKPGEVSGPVRSDYGWHLIKCLDDQETTFEEAQERIYLELLKRKRHELFDGIMKKVEQKDFF
ncbi:MAG: peptidylprolyl isomerase [Planctomycetes bacterium]|nr:peptidylprolyl isomerase [Planctomycetota bacterium]